MTFNDLLDTLNVNSLSLTMQKDLDGNETGYATQWDASTRTRVVMSPEALAGASDSSVNNFVVIPSSLVSKDKTVLNKETGAEELVKGQPYVNNFVILGEPTITFGRH